jgi:hypothetical protein
MGSKFLMVSLAIKREREARRARSGGNMAIFSAVFSIL